MNLETYFNMEYVVNLGENFDFKLNWWIQKNVWICCKIEYILHMWYILQCTNKENLKL